MVKMMQGMDIMAKNALAGLKVELGPPPFFHKNDVILLKEKEHFLDVSQMPTCAMWLRHCEGAELGVQVS